MVTMAHRLNAGTEFPQGARYNPKTKINHTYVVGDAIPTTY